MALALSAASGSAIVFAFAADLLTADKRDAIYLEVPEFVDASWKEIPETFVTPHEIEIRALELADAASDQFAQNIETKPATVYPAETRDCAEVSATREEQPYEPEREEDTAFNELTPSDMDRLSDVPNPCVNHSFCHGHHPANRGVSNRWGRVGLHENGGDGNTESVVEAALKWLKRHQGQSGNWSAKSFGERCDSDPEFPGRCVETSPAYDAGFEEADTGLTALALMAFLAAGHTNTQGNYRRTVQNSLRWLLQQQQPDGRFGSADGPLAVFNHAVATIAVAESYGVTAFERLATPAQNAVDLIASAEYEDGGWDNGGRPGAKDFSITVWMVSALWSAKKAGLHMKQEVLDCAREYIDKVVDPLNGFVRWEVERVVNANLLEASGVANLSTYPTLAAASIWAKTLLGVSRDDASMRYSANVVFSSKPTWSFMPDGYLEYCYFGSLAMFQTGTEWISKWNESMKSELIQTQWQGERRCIDGSWDPAGSWGAIGGRVYATAMACLCLEVYYRYDFISPMRRD
ncbi:MAG: hypothetical protein NUW37_08075 [Planctomycetes bacterium]|nr:hypothetical protein [Planctomycetota bacterium]